MPIYRNPNLICSFNNEPGPRAVPLIPRKEKRVGSQRDGPYLGFNSHVEAHAHVLNEFGFSSRAAELHKDASAYNEITVGRLINPGDKVYLCDDEAWGIPNPKVRIGIIDKIDCEPEIVMAWFKGDDGSYTWPLRSLTKIIDIPPQAHINPALDRTTEPQGLGFSGHGMVKPQDLYGRIVEDKATGRLLRVVSRGYPECFECQDLRTAGHYGFLSSERVRLCSLDIEINAIVRTVWEERRLQVTRADASHDRFECRVCGTNGVLVMMPRETLYRICEE